MPCPTCSHTLHGIGYNMWHCSRCGTLVNCPTDGCVSVPALVGRCREFEKAIRGAEACCPSMAWQRLGVAEAIRLPEDLPTKEELKAP